MTGYSIVSMLQVRPNMLLTYDKIIWHNGRPPSKKSFPSVFVSVEAYGTRHDITKEKAYTGQLSPGGKKRLARALNLIVAQALPKKAMNFKSNTEFEFKINFVTLTLPAAQGAVKDSEIKKTALDPFLKSMRYKHGLQSYVWRAERQFNGNVHFHLTTDTYLPYDSICDTWNKQLAKFKYIDQFEASQGHRHPNSTDVHSVQKIRNIAAYMVKYMSKNPADHLKEINAKRSKKGLSPIDPEKSVFRDVPGQPKWDDPIHGKVWDCSKNLKIKHNCEMEISPDIYDSLTYIEKTFQDKCCEGDHFWLCTIPAEKISHMFPDHVKASYDDYLASIRKMDTS